MSNASQLPMLVYLAALRGQGATHVVITYSGQGDDGGIDSIAAIGQGNTTYGVPEDVQAALDTWANEVIPGDYVNNEGGSGTITLDLTTFVAEIEHIDNVEEAGDDVTVELTPSAEALEFLAGAKHAGIATADLAIYPDDGPFLVQAYDSPLQKCARWDVFAEWLNDAIADFDTGDEGGGGNVMVDLTDDQPVVTATHYPTNRGEEARTVEVSL
jgi:hypothetical protein